jgi:hypothetical protein
LPRIDQLAIAHEFLFNITKNSVELFSVEFFTEKACKTPRLVNVNSFNLKSQKWSKNLTHFEKHQNFHGCLRVFGIVYGSQANFNNEIAEKIGNSPNSLQLIESYLNKGEKLRVSLDRVLKIIAKAANFTPHYQMRVAYYDDNGKSTFELVSTNGKNFKELDDWFCSYSYYEDHWQNLHLTTIWTKWKDFVIMTPPGMPFSPYEKLFLPFDQLTWIFLGCTFSIGLFVILIVNQMREKIQNIFFGKGVKSPTVNLLQIFFGIGMTKLPRNNFARIILIQFVMFCVVIRNGYQGK